MCVVQSESESESDSSIPDLPVLQSSRSVQKQVKARLREFEAFQEKSSTLNESKIKSKRGGLIEVVVKNKIALPHEAILGGINSTSMS